MKVQANCLRGRRHPYMTFFVALFGGAAGIVSIACKNKGQVMPGVAIATSLMPPLCTAGYGIATLQSHFFFGALYLFFTNMIFILFASLIGVKLMNFKKVVYQDTRRSHRVQMIVYSVVFVTIGFSCYLTYEMIRKNIFMTEATSFVENEMVFPNTQVLNQKIYMNGNQRHIDVTLIGQALPKDSLQLAMMTKLDSVGLGGTILNIKQGFSISENRGRSDEENFGQFYSVMQKEVADRQEKIDSLKDLLKDYSYFNRELTMIAPEVKALFPSIKDIAMSRMVATSLTNSQADTINMVFVNAPKGMSAGDKEKLISYVKIRLKENKVHLTLNPSDFPWPSVSSVKK